MSKRRRGQNTVHHQVPTLRSLAQHAVHLASGRPVARPSRHFPNVQSRGRMDTKMSEQPPAKRQRNGAEQVGQGLEVSIPKNVPHLFNNNYTVKLTYADNFFHNLAQNGTASASQVFRMNSIFDPDFTGTGHQPILRDLWASQYDYYTVLQCDYSIRLYNGHAEAVTFTSVGTNAQKVGCVNVVHFLGSTNSSDMSAAANGMIYPAAEMKNTTTSFLIPDDYLELKGSLTQGDFIVDAKDADSDNTWVAVGSNPAIPRFFGYVISPAVWVALGGVNEAPYSTIQVQVVIDYTVQFTQMNQSLRSVSS